MKKVFSISLSLLMVAAMLHISVAMHYCGGKEVATTVSLSGKLASCGMECSEEELPLTGTYFNKQCCADIVTTFGIDNHYTPTYSFIPESFQYNFQVLAIPVELSAKSQTDLNLLYTSVSPPGVLMSTKVDLSNICVFRI
jgi:hypothetical protein